MGSNANWLASSVFFLAGCIMYVIPDVVRGHLYAALFTRPPWQYPSSTVENVVPYYLRGIGFVAFVLAAAALVLPLFQKARDAQSEARSD